jgi:hypothetical protein
MRLAGLKKQRHWIPSCRNGIVIKRGNKIIMRRGFAIFITILILIIVGIYLSVPLTFSGVFDKKYSREELTRNFVKHEKDFSDDKVSLDLYPTVIDPANKIIGGDDLKPGSAQLDSALTKLGWTRETVKLLRDKLSRTNCDWIRTTGISHRRIEMYPNQSGWGSYTYSIYNMPIVDSLVQVYGKPLSNSAFGRKVVLHYSSAL